LLQPNISLIIVQKKTTDEHRKSAEAKLQQLKTKRWDIVTVARLTETTMTSTNSNKYGMEVYGKKPLLLDFSELYRERRLKHVKEDSNM
jgi:hypothetical protein